MNVVAIDVEANGLRNPTKVWCVVCMPIGGEKTYQSMVFRNLTEDADERRRFLDYAKGVDRWVGHNFLSYDWPVLRDLVGLHVEDIASKTIDTLIISKLVDYSREEGHSIESYAAEFGEAKSPWDDFSQWSLALEERCKKDTEIGRHIYLKYLNVIENSKYTKSILLEHRFQLLVNDLETNGFSFNTTKAKGLLDKVTKELKVLDKDILDAFPARQVIVRHFTPKHTKFGTISKASVPRILHDRITEFEAGVEYPLYKTERFNPSSHKQLIRVLNEAGWSPVVKTTTHINTERELQRLKYKRQGLDAVDLERQKSYNIKMEHLRLFGWKVNEDNLLTLPESAPAPARLLAKRILLESRRRTLTEWLGLVSPDTSRIHGQFYGIGAWTHRMAHQKPNTANIPSEYKEDGTKKLLGKEMRSLWQAPRNRLLVGVDADSIQFRVAAHYINDPNLIRKIVEGKKSDKTDPHSYNKTILEPVCKHRNASKRVLFSLILGGGAPKLATILGSNREEAAWCIERLYQEYPGLVELKQRIVVEDAKRGYFIGLDGRKVPIPGDTVSERKHLCPSGYLQNGEVVIMKHGAVLWSNDKEMIEINKEFPWYFVDMVHDEWQTEVVNNMKIALRIADIQSNSLRIVGEELGLKCPLAGSYWNDDHKDYTIGVNWYQTH